MSKKVFSVSITVGQEFESKLPLNVGPGPLEHVVGFVSAIHPPAGRIRVTSHDKTKEWLIYMTDAMDKNRYLEVSYYE